MRFVGRPCSPCAGRGHEWKPVAVDNIVTGGYPSASDGLPSSSIPPPKRGGSIASGLGELTSRCASRVALARALSLASSFRLLVSDSLPRLSQVSMRVDHIQCRTEIGYCRRHERAPGVLPRTAPPYMTAWDQPMQLLHVTRIHQRLASLEYGTLTSVADQVGDVELAAGMSRMVGLKAQRR